VKKLAYLALSILIVGVTALCVYRYRADLGLALTRGNPALSSPGNSTPHLVITWQKVDRTPDGFKVDMPAGTSRIQVPAYTRTGGQEPVQMLQSSAVSGSTYAVAWADNPPVERASGDVAEKTFDMARDGALARTQATLTSESRINRADYSERDFSGSNASGGILNMRLILAGTRLYTLIATFPAASSNRDEDMSHFFNSFSLTSSPKN
jgi:hypothetical protein